MEPVARRTRRQQQKLKQHRELKLNTSSSSRSRRQGPQVIVLSRTSPADLTSSGSSSSEEEQKKNQSRQPSSSRAASTPVSRKVKKQKVVTWSSSESESESSGDVGSDYAEQEEDQEDDDDAEMVEVDVQVEDKLDALGTFENPIILRADPYDDEDDSDSSAPTKDSEGVQKAKKSTLQKQKHNVAVNDEEEEEKKNQSPHPSSSRVVSSPVSRNLEKQKVVTWSSSRSESESSGDVGSEESDHAKEEEDHAEMVELDVQVDDKCDPLGTFERPIVLRADDEDDDSDSSRPMKESECVEKAKKSTSEKQKHNVAVNDEEAAEEEEEEKEEAHEEVKEKVDLKKDKVKMRQTRGPLTATEIKKVLLNSIMEENNANVYEDTVKKSHEMEEPSYSSEDDSGEKIKIKDPRQEEIDECYFYMNACLAFSETSDFGAESMMEVEDSGKTQKQRCKEGKHHLVVEEQIGVFCSFCSYVREEIRDYIEPFHDNPFAASSKDEYSTYGNRGPTSLPYLEDPNIGYQHFQAGSDFDTSGTVWEIMPGLRDNLLPQQREAFEFIWRHVGGGTNPAELLNKRSNDGGGCLISHAPGTGKTRLAIAFLQTYMKFCKNSRPVVLAPASILLSWKQEFQKWKVDVPFLNLNEDELSEKEMMFGSSLFGKSYLRNLDMQAKRLIKLRFWIRHESVLAISYSLFPLLVEQDESLRKLLIEMPGVLVLDEAHMPRNESTRIFKVLKKVKTKKRILLSGTPFQNNFRELRNILCLVRKEFNNEIDPFKKSGVNESDEGKIKDLKEKMKPFLHCCGNHVLLATLPGLVEFNIYLQPSEHQKSLLRFEEEHRKGHLESQVNMTLISIHPMLLSCKDTKTGIAQELKSGRWDLSESTKTRFLIRLIQISAALEERVLVFSQYREPLNFIKAILQSHHFGWTEGIEIHLMNGSQEMETRKRTMDLFNKSRGKAKVMLASTKACSEGIELTGASRVVLLDIAWNPAVERQAISRAFRMGQLKVVHVYHLIMTGNDSNRYMSQNKKISFSNYMFSSDKRSGDGPEPSTRVNEDIILDRLREENIIKEATQVKTSDNCC